MASSQPPPSGSSPSLSSASTDKTRDPKHTVTTTLTPALKAKIEASRLAALSRRSALSKQRAAAAAHAPSSTSSHTGRTYTLLTKGYEESAGDDGDSTQATESAFDSVKGVVPPPTFSKAFSSRRASSSSSSFTGEEIDRLSLLSLTPHLPLSSAATPGGPAAPRQLLPYTDATTIYLVPRSDLSTLPYCTARNSHGFEGSSSCRLVRVDQVRELCLRRFGGWEQLEEERGGRERRKAERIREEILGGRKKKKRKR